MKTAVLVLAVLVSATTARAGGFEELLRLVPAAMIPEAPQPPAKGSTKPLPGDDVISIQALSSLPPTDPAVKNWLASRIPGLNTANLKTVPVDAVEKILQRAGAARASYLDIFTDPGLGRSNPDSYYLDQAVLADLNKRWVSGTLPVEGATSDGHQYHMQALVAGQGAVYILYDLSSFQFKDGKNDYRIVDAGRVSVSVLGRNDVGVGGVKAHGCRGPFCAWVDIQRITKTGPTTVHVKTSRGDQDTDLQPVHAR